jgi:D-threo-aldose 1-dehydrogenase
VDRARRIAAVRAEHGVELPQMAIRFPLGHPAVVGVVVGSRTAEQVRQNAGHFAAPVPAELRSALRDGGLLAPEVPVP